MTTHNMRLSSEGVESNQEATSIPTNIFQGPSLTLTTKTTYGINIPQSAYSPFGPNHNVQNQETANVQLSLEINTQYQQELRHGKEDRRGAEIQPSHQQRERTQVPRRGRAERPAPHNQEAYHGFTVPKSNYECLKAEYESYQQHQPIHDQPPYVDPKIVSLSRKIPNLEVALWETPKLRQQEPQKPSLDTENDWININVPVLRVRIPENDGDGPIYLDGHNPFDRFSPYTSIQDQERGCLRVTGDEMRTWDLSHRSDRWLIDDASERELDSNTDNAGSN